jgi:uncharacterized protein (DUF1330 family)
VRRQKPLSIPCKNKVILGKVTFVMLLVMDFDSAERIEKLFGTSEYNALIPYHYRHSRI